MNWYNYVVFVIFLIMLVSPAWFFQKLEKILHEDYTGDDAMTVDAHVSSHNIIPQFDTEQSLSRDEKILNNLNGIIKKSQKLEAKTMWELKKIEYLRELNWRKHYAIIIKG